MLGLGLFLTLVLIIGLVVLVVAGVGWVLYRLIGGRKD